VSRTMTLRLDADTLARLDELAQATDRSKAWLAAQAVKAYIAVNERQTQAIRDAVKERTGGTLALSAMKRLTPGSPAGAPRKSASRRCESQVARPSG
jgi:RHH-type rel operon transcriptional repressor/antitoxin RelB